MLEISGVHERLTLPEPALRALILLLVLALPACATKSVITMVSRADRQVVNGTVDWFNQSVGITLNGRNYRGDYVFSPAPQTTVVVNNNSDRKGARDGSAGSTSNVQRSSHGPGKLLLISDAGDSLRCDFTYDESIGMKAVGTCIDNTRREYDLRISTAF